MRSVKPVMRVRVFVTYPAIKPAGIVDLDVTKSHGVHICPTTPHSLKLA